MDRFHQMANSVEEFTVSLLDPMRSRENGERRQFATHLLNEISDDAIQFEQKKVGFFVGKDYTSENHS